MGVLMCNNGVYVGLRRSKDNVELQLLGTPHS